MDLPADMDHYIKQSIQDSVGLPVSSQTLEAKLRASQESQRLLRDQHLFQLSKLKEKDKLIELAKSEATMNALALKKFVEENQKLALECEKLVAQCHKWERECALYDRDRETLMEFGNDADERAREAHSRVLELERNLLLLEDELKKYKHEHELKKCKHELVDSSAECTHWEENILDSLLATVSCKDDDSTFAFLKANSENESCKKLLTIWNCITPSTRRVLSLVAEAKSLEKDKEHLKTNLHRAEEEVKLLFDENKILDEENKSLLRQYKERNHPGSGGKYTGSASAKSNKRKSSPKTSSPMERKIDFDNLDSARQPLSPLGSNSPECRMHKKLSD